MLDYCFRPGRSGPDLNVSFGCGESCRCFVLLFESSGNAALDKRKLFGTGKGLFVREGVKQNCIAQGSRFQSCTEEKT